MVTISLRGVKKSRHTLKSGLTCLWDSGSTYIMIKRNNVNIYDPKLRDNTVDYSTAAGPYKTTHAVNVPFIMPYFSSTKIITHRFHFDKNRCNEGIDYVIITGRDIMIK